MNGTGGQGTPKSAVLTAYQIHFQGLKRFLARMLSSPHDVEDAVQETFIRAHLAERSSHIQQPKSYLFKIARNVALNQLRQKMRRPTDYIEDYDPAITMHQDSTLEDEVMAQEKFEILCAAIATLPPQCRKIYLMRKVYGLSYKDIATALTLSVKTVEMHIQKGYSRCDQYMNKHLSDESRYVESRLVKKGGLKNG